MTLVLGPIVIALAILALVAPRLFGFLMRLAVFLVILCLLYVVDGQREHPTFPHDYGMSDAVR